MVVDKNKTNNTPSASSSIIYSFGRVVNVEVLVLGVDKIDSPVICISCCHPGSPFGNKRG